MPTTKANLNLTEAELKVAKAEAELRVAMAELKVERAELKVTNAKATAKAGEQKAEKSSSPIDSNERDRYGWGIHSNLTPWD